MEMPMDYAPMDSFSNRGFSVLQDNERGSEVSRQLFRQLQYTAAAGPRETFRKLWELCCEWLKPKMHSIEQILEMLVLEQFLSILPPDIETRVRAHGPQTKERLFSLIEHIQRKYDKSEFQIDFDDIILQEFLPLETELMPPNFHPESPALQAKGTHQDSPVPEAWKPQAGPQELNYSVGAECQPFVNPGPELPMSDCSFPMDKVEDQWADELMNLQTDENPHQEPDLSEELEQQEALCKALPNELLDVLEIPLHTPRSCLEENSQQERPVNPGDATQKTPIRKAHHCAQCGKCSVYAHKQPGSPEVIRAEELMHKCALCEEGFFHSPDLDEQEVTGVKARHYQCPKCEETFTQHIQLTTHQAMHIEMKPFQCQYCSKRFLHRSSLLEHRKTHTGEKSHECPTCGKKFLRRATLSQHQVTHTTERPFTCEYCKKSYRHRSSLRSHIKTHAGEVLYKCNLCLKSFLNKENIILHLAAHLRKGLPATRQEAGAAGPASTS
ncbi:zinc finger protein 75D isoform X1 [Dipodomys merriami]|uniref:zinc finger protein 75D isoform X1 n=1 Tax=Dipodomys merriami TaxID=94247 RepID=UPI00385570C4